MPEIVTLPKLNPMRTAPRDRDFLGMEWEGAIVRLRWNAHYQGFARVGREGAWGLVIEKWLLGWWPLPEVNDA